MNDKQVIHMLNRKLYFNKYSLKSIQDKTLDIKDIKDYPGFTIPIVYLDFLNYAINNHNFDVKRTKYWDLRIKQGFKPEVLEPRLHRFVRTFNKIKDNGWDPSSRIIIIKRLIDQKIKYTRIDGSHRTACAAILNIPIMVKICDLEEKDAKK